jgi:hypothetical protein
LTFLAARVTMLIDQMINRRSHFISGLGLFALFLLASWSVAIPAALGASVYWQASSGDWSLASNWSGSLPSTSDAVYVVNGGTVTVSKPGERYGTLSLGSGAGSGTVQMTDGNLSSVWNQNVGDSGTGTMNQFGGTNSVNTLNIGYGVGGYGTYSLSGSGSLSTRNEYSGYAGVGTLIQSGGTNTITSALNLGNFSGSTGMYNLSGIGRLSVKNVYVGTSGTGAFLQTGGTDSIASYLYVGSSLNGNGSYSLSGGLLSASSEYIGYTGTGDFTQSGGSHGISGSLYLGYSANSGGTYNLSGNGQLSAANEYVGFASGNAARFDQLGGTNTTSVLSIGSSGVYTLAGGTLQVNSSVSNQGTFTGSFTTGTLVGKNILDLSSGTWQFLWSLNVRMGANSLLIVPSGFNPSNQFASYSSLGLTHTNGTTLVVGAGKTLGVTGVIRDLVNCLGTISSGSLSLNGGLTVSGGRVVLSATDLTTNDTISGISGGSISVPNHYVGKSGPATFTQTGGTNGITNSLYLGYGTGGSGTYYLGGSGRLSVPNESIGRSGVGTFTQTGGTNSVGSLVLAQSAGSNGTYSLQGGLLSLSSLSCGSGLSAFNFSGGTLKAATTFATTMPMNLSTQVGTSMIVTGSNSLTLSGALSGPGSLTLASGKLILSGSNSYSGGTIVTAGTLEAISSNSLLDGTSLAVGSAATSVFKNAGAVVLAAESPGVVPEPSTIALFGIGAVSLAACACRRRKRAA